MATVSGSRRAAQRPVTDPRCPDRVILDPESLTACVDLSDALYAASGVEVDPGAVREALRALMAADDPHISPVPPILASRVEGTTRSTVAQPSRRDAAGAVEGVATERDPRQERGDGDRRWSARPDPHRHPH